jgi:hypothetical protein
VAYIFRPECDPRRENMTEFKTGDKVKYRGMAMPAEILSGPHQSPGAPRWLVRKADGHVTLVPTAYLTRIVPRLDRIAGTLSVTLYGRSYVSLNTRDQVRIAAVAANVLRIADETKEQGNG